MCGELHASPDTSLVPVVRRIESVSYGMDTAKRIFDRLSSFSVSEVPV